jgi:hypothetical protein
MKKGIVVILFDILLSFYYFKQLYITDHYQKLLDLSGVLLTPFALLYSILSLLFLQWLHSTLASKPYQVRRNFFTISNMLFVFIIIAFLLFAFFIKLEKLLIAFLIIIYEPLKNKYFNVQQYNKMLIKNLILLVVSFIILIISISISNENKYTNSSSFYMGGFYFLCLAFIDYKSYKLKLQL